MENFGKGIYVWQSKSIFNSSIGELINYIAYLKLDHIMLKIGDAANNGSRSYSDMKSVVDTIRSHFPTLKILGWHYIYCGAWLDKLGRIRYDNIASPEAEANFAKAQIKNLGLDGYVIDAERELKFGFGDNDRTKNPVFRALRFMGTLKGIGVPVALASYRFPNYHRDFPWESFLDNDLMKYHMPQVYWGNYEHASIQELTNSIRQLKALKDLPFIPTGRAYIGDGHPNPKPSEIYEFTKLARDLDLAGVNYWAMDFLLTHPNGALRSLVIRDFDWGLDQPNVPPIVIPIGEKYRVICNILYKRKGPGKQYGIAGSLKYGDVITVYKKEYGDYVWGLIDPEKSIWCAINYAVKI